MKRENLEKLSVDDLKKRASDADIEGRSDMNKDQLVDALADDGPAKNQGGGTVANDTKSEERDATKLEAFDPEKFAKDQAKQAKSRQEKADKAREDAGDIPQDLPGVGANASIPPENALPISGGFLASDADKDDDGTFKNKTLAAAQAQVDEDPQAAYAHDASKIGSTQDQVTAGAHVERGADGRLHQRSQLRTDFGG